MKVLALSQHKTSTKSIRKHKVYDGSIWFLFLKTIFEEQFLKHRT